MGLQKLFKQVVSALFALTELVISRTLSLFGQQPHTDELTAVIITCGETTYNQCLAAVENQTVAVRVKTVRDIHPLSASLDAALDACETRWLLMIDADTILHSYCIEIMLRKLKPGVGMVVALLLDKVYGPIGYLRLVDAEILKKHRFRHPENDPHPDRKARDFLLQQGLQRIVLRSTVGIHNPYETCFEAFRRFYGTYRKRDSSEQHMDVHVNYILKYACRTKAWSEAYYMMAGLICGALAGSNKKRDYVADSKMQQQFESIAAKDKNYIQ